MSGRDAIIIIIARLCEVSRILKDGVGLENL
jgi:hypothetical protein